MYRLPLSTVAFALLLFAGGCGAPGPLAVPTEASGEHIVWPKPPAEARIGYIKNISGPQDLGLTKSFFRRLLDKLAGRGADHFVRPTGAVMHDGVLYVADPGAPALWILDAPRNRYLKLDAVDDTALESPVAVAVRPDGAVFLADTGLKKVLLFDRDGQLKGVAAQTDLERPAGLAYDAASKRLYVADSATSRISVYDAEAKVVRSWGAGGEQGGQFNHPTHLTLDGAGTLRVTDALNFRIQSFDRDGRLIGSFGHAGDGSGDFAAPKGIATDSGGHIYVVDALFAAVQIFDRDGSFLLGFGEQGTQAGQFWLPGGIFIDPKDEIYVTDGYNQRVQVFRALHGAGKEATE